LCPMDDALLIKTLIVTLGAACAVGLAARVQLPAAVGYLLGGLIIGPHGLHLLEASDETRFLADLGIIFLMFMVGLEFSPTAITAARRDVLGAGSLQVGLTILMVAGAAILAGSSPLAAILLGAAAAMSSSAIALKQLTDQGEISSHHGRLSLGLLLFQDLATVPFLVTIDALGQAGGDGLAVLRQLAIAGVTLGAAAFICLPVFRAALTWVARAHSADLFLLAVLLLALGTAFAGHLVKLAPPIGAFMAGIVVRESDFRHQVEDDIRPFRDILLGLFFFTVGMDVDPSIVAVAPLAVALWILALLPGKAFVTLLSGTIARWPPSVSIGVAIILAHGGEDGLLLLTQGMKVGAIEPQVGKPALLALAAAMALGSILIQRSSTLALLLGRASHRLEAAAEEAAIREASESLRNHIVLCGCGRVGRLVAVVLEAAKMSYIAVESDVMRFRRAKMSGYNVVFGDVSRKAVLEAVGISRARVIVVTFHQRHTVIRLLQLARRKTPDLLSIVSTLDDQDVPALVKAGANTVFPENLAAGLALADQVLLLCGFSQNDAASVVTAVRAELNPELNGHVGI
jgi:CPA2 family monovalent cation:H+ antiporter-2